MADFHYALRCFFAPCASRRRASAGLTPQQYAGALPVKGARERSDLSIGEIAERLSMIRHHSAVELVDRLEKGGLVLRLKDKNDAPGCEVRLSSKAERLMDGPRRPPTFASWRVSGQFSSSYLVSSISRPKVAKK